MEILFESGQENVFQERKRAAPAEVQYHYKLNIAYISNICLKIKTLHLFLIHHLKYKMHLNPTTFSISLETEKNGILEKKTKHLLLSECVICKKRT